MLTRLQKWGNSQGLRISRELLAQADIDVGDSLQVSAHDGTLVVTPARRIRGGVALEGLVDRIREGSAREDLDWGPPSGREVW